MYRTDINTSRRSDSFIRDESGQAMVVGALSMLFILPMVAFVYNAAGLINRKAQLQNAADAAVHSAALVEANALSAIAVSNDAIAYSYYGAMRHAMDVTVSGVLAEFKAQGAPDEVIGIVDAPARYDVAYKAAETWVPRAERWMEKLGELNMAIARVTPAMMSRELSVSAAANGAQAMSFFPDAEFIPEEGFRAVYYIEELDAGWRITNDSGYLLEFIEETDDSWLITESGSGTIEFEKIDATHWRISRGHWHAAIETDGTSQLRIEITEDDIGSTTLVEAREVFAGNWEFSIDGPDFHLHVLPYTDGTYLIEVESTDITYRERVKWDADNRMMVLRGGEYQYLDDQEETVDVNGETVTVDYIRQLTFPGGSFSPPHLVRFREIMFFAPRRLVLPGLEIGIDPGSVTLFGRHDPVRYRVSTDVSFNLNGLTVKDADGRWRIIDERTRHRIVETTNVSWVYELVKDPSDLLYESPIRLGYYAVMENDPDATVTNGAPVLPAWTTWFRIDVGRSESEETYYQTRPIWADGQTGVDYDGDGIGEIRIYQYQVAGHRSPSYQEVNLPRHAALKVSESFWKYGLNVAVWGGAPRSVFARPAGEKKGIFPAFAEVDSGMFAMASARVGFRHKFFDADTPTQEMRYRFDTLEDARDWSLRGYQCLYEPMWSVRLYAIADNIRDDDLEAGGLDFGLPFLFRVLKRDDWFEVKNSDHTADEPVRRRHDVRRAFNAMANEHGNRLDTEDPALREVFHH